MAQQLDGRPIKPVTRPFSRSARTVIPLTLHVQPSIGVYRAPGGRDRYSGSCAPSCGNVSRYGAADISSGGEPGAGNCLVPARCPAAWRVTLAGLRRRGDATGNHWRCGCPTQADSLPRPLAATNELELGPEAIVLNVYVEPAWRRRGVAEAMMRALLNAPAVRSIRRIVLHASPDGRRLYERLGFVPTNEMRLSPR